MGPGIAQVAAQAGFDATVLEVEQKFLDKGFAGIEKSVAERLADKGRNRLLKRLPERTNRATVVGV
jgi:3-hydroxyacyl-CoA dehydrogenase